MLGEFRVEKYQIYHRSFLNRWIDDRELDLDTENLPEVGFIGLHNDMPVAAGFLRQCENNLVIIDSLITDPFELAQVRNKVLDILTDHLLCECKKMGFKKVMALSEDNNTIYRAKKHGFQMRPYTVLTLSVRGDI